jgi:hypothetical protein
MPVLRDSGNRGLFKAKPLGYTTEANAWVAVKMS